MFDVVDTTSEIPFRVQTNNSSEKRPLTNAEGKDLR